MYKSHKDPATKNEYSVIRLIDHAYIPFDPANTDYAEYLRWLDAGNTPLPSDSVADSAASGSVDKLTTNQGA